MPAIGLRLNVVTLPGLGLGSYQHSDCNSSRSARDLGAEVVGTAVVAGRIVVYAPKAHGCARLVSVVAMAG